MPPAPPYIFNFAAVCPTPPPHISFHRRVPCSAALHLILPPHSCFAAKKEAALRAAPCFYPFSVTRLAPTYAALRRHSATVMYHSCLKPPLPLRRSVIS